LRVQVGLILPALDARRQEACFFHEFGPQAASRSAWHDVRPRSSDASIADLVAFDRANLRCGG
jgi:hypothetical protein